MKRSIALFLIFTILLVFVGCQATQAPSTETSSTANEQNVNVMKAWSGEFSEEKLKQAINEYKSNYTNIVLERHSASNVSFETDLDISSCSVSRLAQVDDSNIEIELHNYIDLLIEVKCDGGTVTVPIDWWYTGDDSWVNDHFVWSYLVYIEDANGGSHYYYFRVDYSAYA